MGFSKSSKKRLDRLVLTFGKRLKFLGKLTICKCKLITENKNLTDFKNILPEAFEKMVVTNFPGNLSL